MVGHSLQHSLAIYIWLIIYGGHFFGSATPLLRQSVTGISRESCQLRRFFFIHKYVLFLGCLFCLLIYLLKDLFIHICFFFSFFFISLYFIYVLFVCLRICIFYCLFLLFLISYHSFFGKVGGLAI